MVRIENENGTITITGDVFTNLAGDAAMRSFGVKGMAGKSKESGLYQLLRRESMSKGVFVTFEEDGSISIALHIVVEYGVNIAAACRSIRSEVKYKVEEATGVRVAEVEVYVDTMTI